MDLVQVVQFELDDGGGADASWVPYPYPGPLSWDMHQAFEVQVVLSGRVERHFEGYLRTLGPGDICLIPAWEPHGHRAVSPGATAVRTFFLPGFLGDEMLGDLSWLSFFMAAPRERPWVGAEETRRQVLGMAEELKQEIDERDRGWLTSLRLGLLRLLWVTGRNWEPPAAGHARHSARLSDLARVAPALELVHSRAGRSVSLAEAAAACCLSASRFSPVFRHTMGLSFGEFVLRQRGARVAQLLLHSNASLVAIAEELGFVDASHLHRVFARRYGYTPARYRKMARSFHQPGTRPGNRI